MLGNRITGPDGIAADLGPPPRRHSAGSAVRHGVRIVRALLALACSRDVRHRPSRNELRLMVTLDGRAPATYRLDPAVNPLPSCPPTGFPYGANGLRFTRGAGGDMVALPTGCGYSL